MNSTAKNVDDYLATLPDWQSALLQNFRTQIYKASGDITEEIKWGVPAFIYKTKILFTMAAFKKHVKYNFIAGGAALDDPVKLFNNGLESKTARSIDILEGQAVDAAALQQLVQAAIIKADQA